MLIICYTTEAIALIFHTFTVPANGKIFYVIYSMLQAISMAGINSGSSNLIYDYFKGSDRVGALAIKNAIAGTVGFLTTLTVSRLVTYIQNNGNNIFGIKAYAQQVVSVISFTVVIILMLYVHFVIKPMNKEREKKSVTVETKAE